MDRVSIEILELTNDRIKFALTGCDTSLANALRRILIAEVPTLAPHLVSLVENTSVLHDEFLCQRIGLIPFVSDSVDQFKYPWECSCTEKNIDDCQICKAYFVLEVINLNDQVLNVTSLDIRPVFEPLRSYDDRIRPVLPVQYYSGLTKSKQIGIPIVKLARNQEVKLRFQVQKGIGKMHAKWSPVCQATFSPDPDIRLDPNIELTLAQKIKIRDSCPTKVFEVHESVFEVVSPEKCIFCNECKISAESIDMNKMKNLIRIGKKKDRFIFTVESIQSMPVVQIVKKAMSVLREKLKEIEESIH